MKGEKEIAEARPETFTSILATKERIKIRFNELTFKCPKTGYPDFAKLELEYIPDSQILELRSFKLWLNSFRDVYIGYEKLMDRIFTELQTTLEPKWIKLKITFNPRGNVHTSITAEEGNK